MLPCEGHAKSITSILYRDRIGQLDAGHRLGKTRGYQRFGVSSAASLLLPRPKVVEDESLAVVRRTGNPTLKIHRPRGVNDTAR